MTTYPTEPSEGRRGSQRDGSGRLHRLRGEHGRLNRHVHVLVAVITSFYTLCVVYDENTKSTADEVEALKAKLKHADKIISKARVSKTALTNQTRTLTAELQAARALIASSQSDTCQTQTIISEEQITALKQSLEESRAREQSLLNDSNILKNEFSSYSLTTDAKLNELRAELEGRDADTTARLQEKDDLHNAALTEFTLVIDSLKADVQAAISSRESIESELHKEREVNHGLQRKISNLSTLCEESSRRLSELDVLTDRLQTVESQNQQLMSQLDSKAMALANVSVKADSLKDMIRSLSEKLNSYDALEESFQSIQKQLQTTREDFEKCQADKHSAVSKSNALQLELDRLLMDHAVASEETDALLQHKERELQRMKSELSQGEEVLVTVETEVRALRSHKHEHEGVISRLSTDKDNLVQEIDNQRRDFEKQLVVLTADYAGRTAAKDKEAADAASLASGKLAHLEVEKSDLGRELSLVKDAIRRADARISELVQQATSLHTDLKESTRDLGAMRVQNSELQALLSEKNELMQVLAREKQTCHERMTVCERDKAAAEVAVRDVEGKVADCERRLREKSREMSEMSATIAKQQQELLNLDTLVTDREQSLLRVQELLSTSAMELEVKLTEMSQLRDQVDRHRAVSDQARAQTAAAVKSADATAAEIERMRTDHSAVLEELRLTLSQTQEESNALLVQLETSQDEASKLTMEKASLTDSMNDVNVKLAAAVAEVCCVRERAEVAEANLARLDDRKKRDLDLLKKHHERIKEIEKVHAEKEQMLEDTIDTLRSQLEEAEEGNVNRDDDCKVKMEEKWKESEREKSSLEQQLRELKVEFSRLRDQSPTGSSSDESFVVVSDMWGDGKSTATKADADSTKPAIRGGPHVKQEETSLSIEVTCLDSMKGQQLRQNVNVSTVY